MIQWKDYRLCCCFCCSLTRVRLFVPPGTVVHQAPLSIGIPQAYRLCSKTNQSHLFLNYKIGKKKKNIFGLKMLFTYSILLIYPMDGDVI